MLEYKQLMGTNVTTSRNSATSSELIPAASFAALDVAILPPAPVLSGLIQCLWAIRACQGPALAAVEKLYPDAGSSLTFEFSPQGARATFCHHSTVLPHTWYSDTDYISVRFRPGGAKALLGLAVEDTQTIDLPLSCAAGYSHLNWQALTDALFTTVHQNRAGVLYRWLLSQLHRQSNRKNPWPSLINYASSALITPQALAEYAGMSRRTLERQLKTDVGFSPAQIRSFAQIRRARQLLIQSNHSLSDIALQCAFFDQAHFTNVFRAHTQETPHQYQIRKLSHISNLS